MKVAKCGTEFAGHRAAAATRKLFGPTLALSQACIGPGAGAEQAPYHYKHLAKMHCQEST